MEEIIKVEATGSGMAMFLFNGSTHHVVESYEEVKKLLIPPCIPKAPKVKDKVKALREGHRRIKNEG